MPIRNTPRVTTPRAPSRTRDVGVKPEPAAALADRYTFSSPRFGEGRIHLAPDRYRFDDHALYSKGKAGDAVGWRLRGEAFNDFWVSLNNRSDPALLRAQARFLELSKGTRDPSTRRMRAELQAQVQQLLTTGLDDFELGYFPRPVAVSVVKRLALAAGVPVSDVRVQPRNGRELPDSLRSDAQRVTSLLDWEARPEPATLSKFQPVALKETEQGRRDRAELEKQVARMTDWFSHNPRGTLAQYSAEVEYNDRHADHAFWGAMQDMMDRADLAELAGPGGVRGGKGAEWFATGPVTRPSTPTVAAPTRPATTPSRPNTMTTWEMVSHPQFADYLSSKQAGFRGSFNDFIWR